MAVSRPAVVVTALGIVQITGWGSTYYLLAVLAPMIVADTGWSLQTVVAGLAVGLLAGGVASPAIGRLIQHRGGRPVLSGSMVLLCLGLILIGSAPLAPIYLMGWCLLGFGMAAGLYDACFATLGRLYGKAARRLISTVTLWGGFSSTVCWPMTAYFGEAVGWRATCFVYAGINLLVCLPLVLVFVPRSGRAGPPPTTDRAMPPRTSSSRSTFLLLTIAFTVASLINSMLAVHLLTIVTLQGHDLATAVMAGAIIGPPKSALAFSRCSSADAITRPGSCSLRRF